VPAGDIADGGNDILKSKHILYGHRFGHDLVKWEVEVARKTGERRIELRLTKDEGQQRQLLGLVPPESTRAALAGAVLCTRSRGGGGGSNGIWRKETRGKKNVR
jgi:hypothetical protein